MPFKVKFVENACGGFLAGVGRARLFVTGVHRNQAILEDSVCWCWTTRRLLKIRPHLGIHANIISWVLLQNRALLQNSQSTMKNTGFGALRCLEDRPLCSRRQVCRGDGHQCVSMKRSCFSLSACNAHVFNYLEATASAPKTLHVFESFWQWFENRRLQK